MKKLSTIEKEVKSLERKLFSNLEIVCHGNKVHTGVDVDMLINGNSIVHPLRACSIDWNISGHDTGVIKIIYCPTKDGKVILKDKDTILEDEIIIDYPIKKIDLKFKNKRVVSDNTRIGTEVFIEGKPMCKILGIVSIRVTIGDADTINEIEMVMC